MTFDTLDTLLAPLDAVHLRADCRIVHVPGFARVEVPSAPESWRNEVYHCALTGGVDRVFEETFARYAELGTAWKWSVGPGSTPGLAERLEERGRSWTVLALGCETAGWSIPVPDDVEVRPVDLGNLEDFFAVTRVGWGTVNPYPDRLRADLRHGVETGSHRFFVSYVQGEPMGTSSWVPRTHGPAYLSGGMVLERFRGRGAYRALIAARLRDMAAEGHERAITLSRAHTSGPILEKLGLTPLFRYPIFELPASSH